MLNGKFQINIQAMRGTTRMDFHLPALSSRQTGCSLEKPTRHRNVGVTLRFLLLFLAWATVQGYAQQDQGVLEVPNSLTRPEFGKADSALSYLGHFEDEQAGGFCKGLQPRFWIDDAPKNPFVIRAVRGGGHVLELNGTYATFLDLPFEERLAQGSMRISFDLLLPAKPGEHPRSEVFLSCASEPVDIGWQVFSEYGPYLKIDCRAPALYSVAWDKKETQLAEFERSKWYRVSMNVDLCAKKYDVTVDGKVSAENIAFRDYRWFMGADALSFSGGRVLLDNIAVSYEPREEAEAVPPPAATVRVPVIPVPRLSAPPVLDGELDDAVWQQAHLSRGLVTAQGVSSQPEAKIWIGYRQDRLYVAASVRKLARSGQLEIQLDPSGGRYDRYVWFRVDHQGEKSQGFSAGNWPGGTWEGATSHQNGFWTVECSIPLSACIKAEPSMSAWAINVILRPSTDAEPAMLSANYGELAETRRFAQLTGLDRYNTRPIRCLLSVREPLLVGQAELSLRLDPSESVAEQDAVASVTISGPDGKSLHHELPLGTIKPAAKRTYRLPVPITRSGGHMFQAAVWPAGLAQDQRNSQNQLGASASQFGVAKNPGALEVQTDRNYYTNEELVRVRGKLIGKTLGPGTVAVMELPSGDSVFRRRQPVSSTPFIVELPLKEVDMGESRLNVRLMGPDESELASAETSLIRRVPRMGEVKIRWDQTILVNGEPFFPLVVWGGTAHRTHALGCNTQFFSSFSNPADNESYYRTSANHLGLQAMLWAAHPTVNPQQVAQRMARFSEDMTNVLAWFIEDEPWPLPKTQPVADLEAKVGQIDPYHPTFITWVASWSRVYADGMMDCDVAGVNSYPSYWHYEAGGTYRATQMIRAAVADAKPVWMTLQFWHSQESRVNPTPTEFRHMVWSAVVAGANGIGFWGCDHRNGFAGEDIRGLLSDRLLWEEAGRVIRAVRRLSPVIVADELVAYEATGDNENVRMVTKRLKDTLYILVLNMRAGPEEVNLTLPGCSGRLINELRPAGSWQMSNGVCHLKLDGLQPLMLRVETDHSSRKSR